MLKINLIKKGSIKNPVFSLNYNFKHHLGVFTKKSFSKNELLLGKILNEGKKMNTNSKKKFGKNT